MCVCVGGGGAVRRRSSRARRSASRARHCPGAGGPTTCVRSLRRLAVLFRQIRRRQRSSTMLVTPNAPTHNPFPECPGPPFTCVTARPTAHPVVTLPPVPCLLRGTASAVRRQTPHAHAASHLQDTQTHNLCGMCVVICMRKYFSPTSV